MKNKIKYIALGLMGAIFIDGVAFTIFSLASGKYGDLADWVSGLGTLAAFFAVFWQQHSQENMERAFRIEQGRPRFMIMYSGKLPNETNVLFNTIGNYDLLYDFIINHNGELITLENISNNTIYTLEVIIEYRLGDKQYWRRNGIHGGDVVAFAPSFLLTKNLRKLSISKVKARFLTVSNEIGFYKYDFSKDKESYYFVENEQNSQIKASESGKMVSKNAIEVKEWNKEFDDLKGKFLLQSTIPYGQLKRKMSKQLINPVKRKYVHDIVPNQRKHE